MLRSYELPKNLTVFKANIMEHISFQLAQTFMLFSSIVDFEEHCLNKASSIDKDTFTVYFSDDSYIQFHNNEFTAGSPMEMEWVD